MGRLDNKIAIVTGAGCVGAGLGNGRAIATRFVEEGSYVLAVDLSLDQLEDTMKYNAAFKDRIIPHQCDVTDVDQVEAMIEACVTRFGSLDILVNNVGGSSKGGPVELSAEDW